jgi:hypothetical protein
MESYQTEKRAMSPSRLVIDSMGRGTGLVNIATLVPSCLTQNSSSSMASSGVWQGMAAAGVMRSLNSRK